VAVSIRPRPRPVKRRAASRLAGARRARTLLNPRFRRWLARWTTRMRAGAWWTGRSAPTK
jgi:hypothetical protein